MLHDLSSAIVEATTRKKISPVKSSVLGSANGIEPANRGATPYLVTAIPNALNAGYEVTVGVGGSGFPSKKKSKNS